MFTRFLLKIPAFFGKVLRFGVICAVMGVLSFLIGELLPRKNIDIEDRLYRPRKWEKNGRVYYKLGIQKWKDRVPDMSRFVPHMFRKKITVMRSATYVEDLIRETCIAEIIHYMLSLLSPVFLALMPPVWGPICMLLYVGVGNLPFIIIQRFNRPRLMEILRRQRALEAAGKLPPSGAAILRTPVRAQ